MKTSMISLNLVNFQHEIVTRNFGKKVKVALLGGDVKELVIHGGVSFDQFGGFRYVMHTAKTPRKPFQEVEGCIIHHANIHAGYYFVDPINIVL